MSFSQMVRALRDVGLTESNALKVFESPGLARAVLAVITESHRTLYCNNHSPVTVNGTVYEWQDFLRQGVSVLLPPDSSDSIGVNLCNTLKRNGHIETMCGLLSRNEQQLNDIRMFGPVMLDHLKNRLNGIGVQLAYESQDQTGFIKISYDWFVRPDMLLLMDTSELGLPNQMAQKFPTVQEAVDASPAAVKSFATTPVAEARLGIIAQLRAYLAT